MYIRRSTRTYKDRTYTNYVLVESVQTPKGPRQKTICSLGDLSPRPREDWLKLAHKLEHALAGQGELLHGDVLPRDPELDGLVEKIRNRRRPPARPAAEHAMPDWIRRTALADILGTDFEALVEDPLYRVLDKLHPHRAAIEAELVERERRLFNLDRTIYLYDLTSTYFEGLAVANDKAQRGYSRDHRPDCKQVVIGLVVNRDGFPIAHEVFKGNTQDRTTLATMLDRLQARIGLPEGATVVVDRGMAYDENIAEITARKL